MTDSQPSLELDLPAPTTPAPARTDTTTADADAGIGESIVADARAVFARLDTLDEQARLDVVNALRVALSAHSPLADQPVDCVLWVPAEQVSGNDYNPNVVAPPELELLRLSIASDGYTQPVVAWRSAEDRFEVVDGFHRHRIGKENPEIHHAVRGRLPVTLVSHDRTDRADRMAATIRHNRARGEHTVNGMSEIVLELARRGKSDDWIGRDLGMDPDEVRRLRQISGLAEMFADQEFSEAWEVDPFTRPPEDTTA